jgi:hypothetical protein
MSCEYHNLWKIKPTLSKDFIHHNFFQTFQNSWAKCSIHGDVLNLWKMLLWVVEIFHCILILLPTYLVNNHFQDITKSHKQENKVTINVIKVISSCINLTKPKKIISSGHGMWYYKDENCLTTIVYSNKSFGWKNCFGHK